MNKIPRKLTTTGVGVTGLLALMKFDVSQLSFFVAIGIIVLSLVSMCLQAHSDIRNGKGNHNGQVNKNLDLIEKQILGEEAEST